MRRSTIFYLILILACGYAHAGHIVKRQSDSSDSSGLTGAIKKVISLVEKIPLIGSALSDALSGLVDSFDFFEIATNGALARLLGGALPCTISLEGTSCSGLSANGGFGAVLMNVIDAIPSLVLPSFAKSLIKLVIQLLVDPTIDVIFGGVPVSS